MPKNGSVLVIGAGIAGMKAGLMLAGASKKVHLVEKLPIIGGKVIKNEESFPNMECSTCMVAPVQQEVLQNSNIETYTYSNVESISGSKGCYEVVIRRKARYISLVNCIGCGMCFDPCPVSIKNFWEENLMDMKAVYVPTAGSLPNVPVIDSTHCLHLNGTQECNLCVEACVFEAIDLNDKDEVVTVEVEAILIATGADIFDLSVLPDLGHGKLSAVYSPLEFERLFAANGPTLGELTLRGTDVSPKRIAIVHCVGRKDAGYCSTVCCMYSFKFVRFLLHKLPDAEIFNIYLDVCVPGKSYQEFFTSLGEKSTKMLFTPSIEDVKVTEGDSALNVSYPDASGETEEFTVDMVILAAAMVPESDLNDLAGIAGIELDSHGFIKRAENGTGSMETTREGIFVAGSAQGPMDIQKSVIQAESAAGQIMKIMSNSAGEQNNESALGS